MGKHKIVKSAAAVALTASVVATAVAPGASAASYKTNSKDQLVYTNSGKLVKGWKVFGGKLYKNGKLAPAKKYKIIGSGASRQLFYGPTLKKGYKTATNKTLLFKDGKLADGWKQAGKNERLYKNGKLDKGYTVYTDVEGEKFLYHNGYLKKGQKTATRGGETLLFVDGKLAKGYVLHEASKTLYNNGKVAKGLVQYPEKDGKFYNDGKLANGEINGGEYKDGVLVAKDIASVKAINGTTVEVTFKEAQKADDVKAADYKIEGLEVKNAAVKQTDSKVVVLTTSAQEAAKEYTLVYKEADTKTFTGVSAVIPTGIALTKASQQGVIGKEVTVEAQVKVAEGQSKAGIPVTIVVDSNKDTNNGGSNNVASDKKVEVYTDENGVAKYSYTQYASLSEDTVYAYPTGDASVKSVAGIVYWGQNTRLALTEVTEGNTLANGAKKVYKVSSPENAGGYINIAFKENIDVTPDKLVRDVTVTDAAGQVTSNAPGQQGNYPYQVTTGGVQYTQVKLDKNGETTFTLTGKDASVTPIVFADGQYPTTSTYTGNNKYSVTELQASAPTVAFAEKATQEITVNAVGTANAAAKTGTDLDYNLGGRDYAVTVKGTDGKIAPKGTKVYVGFKKDDAKGNVEIYKYDAKGNVVAADLAAGVTTDNTANSTVKEFEVDANGQVTFRVAGAKDAFAKPTVFINNGEKSASLDDKDLQTTSEATYFLDAKVANANLTVNDLDKKVNAGEEVEFTYSALDQNGFVYNLADTETTFEVAAKFSDVTVNVGGTATTVPAGKTVTFKGVALVNGQAKIAVTAANAADVVVNASATKVLPNKSETVSFVGSTTTIPLPAETVTAVNTAAKAGDADAVKEALKSVDEFANLTSVEQDEAVANIIKAVKENGSVTSTKILEILKAAGNDTTTPPTGDVVVGDIVEAVKNAATEAAVLAELKKVTAYKDLKGLDAAATAIFGILEGGGTVTAQSINKAVQEANEAALVKAVTDAAGTVGDATRADVTLAALKALGVTVTDANKAAYQTEIAAAAATDKDSKEDLVAIVQTVDEAAIAAKEAALAKIKAYAATGTGTAPTAEDYTAAGITGVTDVTGLNAVVVDSRAAKGADLTVAELQTAVTAAEKAKYFTKQNAVGVNNFKVDGKPVSFDGKHDLDYFDLDGQVIVEGDKVVYKVTGAINVADKITGKAGVVEHVNGKDKLAAAIYLGETVNGTPKYNKKAKYFATKVNGTWTNDGTASIQEFTDVAVKEDGSEKVTFTLDLSGVTFN